MTTGQQLNVVGAHLKRKERLHEEGERIHIWTKKKTNSQNTHRARTFLF
jgi:hypothetical protein